MFARTERLLLRPCWEEDAPALAELARSERKVRDLFGGEGGCDLLPPGQSESCHQGDLPRLLVMRRTSAAPELIGIAGLVRSGPGDAQLLCWIARPHRGLGYGTEAARAVVDLARNGLRLTRLRAPREIGRPASFTERLGFRAGELELRPAATPTLAPAEAA